MPLGAAGTWCVFDVAGRLVRQVTLPAAHRLLEIGRSGVYLVATDEDGVERLERHPYPVASGTP